MFDETGNSSGSDSVVIFILLSSFAIKVFVTFAVSDSVFGANGVAMGGSSDFGTVTWVMCTWTTFTLVLWLVTFFFLIMILFTGRGGRFVVLLFLMGVVVIVAVTVAGGVATDAGTPTAIDGIMAVAIVTADVVVGRMIVGMGATTMDSSFLCLVGSIGT